jgi:hypothetical protein
VGPLVQVIRPGGRRRHAVPDLVLVPMFRPHAGESECCCRDATRPVECGAGQSSIKSADNAWA